MKVQLQIAAAASEADEEAAKMEKVNEDVALRTEVIRNSRKGFEICSKISPF